MQHPSLVYIRTAKTASSAVSEWCRARGVKVSINTKWLSDATNQSLLASCKNHFTTVRNPYRRAYSQFKYGKRAGWRIFKEVKTFEDFLKYDVENNLSDRYGHEKSHLTPVYYYLKDVLHQIKHVFKVEELDQQLPQLVEKFNLKPHAKLRIAYNTRYEKKELDDVFKSKEIRDLVYERYKDDFINFNYDKDDYKNLYPEKL